MATHAQLLTRIRLEMQRTDIAASGDTEQGLVDAVDRAIEKWADIKFWFNQTSASVNTVAGTATVSIPAALRTVEDVSYDGKLLRKRRVDEIRHLSDSARPRVWAEADGLIRLWPKPDAIYALTAYGLAELGTPASGASNAWTTDALDLIDAAARKVLYRDYFANDGGFARASAAEAEAFEKLRRETRKKARAGLRQDLPLSRFYTEGHC
jgi:hypothetical protein